MEHLKRFTILSKQTSLHIQERTLYQLVLRSMFHSRLYILSLVYQTDRVARTCDWNTYHTQLYHTCDNDAMDNEQLIQHIHTQNIQSIITTFIQNHKRILEIVSPFIHCTHSSIDWSEPGLETMHAGLCFTVWYPHSSMLSGRPLVTYRRQ